MVSRYITSPIHDLFLTRDNRLIVKSTDPAIKSRLEFMFQHTNPDHKVQIAERIPSNNKFTPSAPTFSVVIKGVDLDISPEEVSQALIVANLTHSKVWRIRSRALDRDTTLVRVISKQQSTIDHLLLHGFRIFHKLHRCEPSHIPPPQPAQCSKCFSFEHPKERCDLPSKCGRCAGDHLTSKCPATAEPKCINCGGNHSSLNKNCPSRPAVPASAEMTAKCKPVPALTDYKEKITCSSKLCLATSYLKATTTALLDIFPHQRSSVITTMKRISRNIFGRTMLVNFSNNQIHITVSPSTLENDTH